MESYAVVNIIIICMSIRYVTYLPAEVSLSYFPILLLLLQYI